MRRAAFGQCQFDGSTDCTVRVSYNAAYGLHFVGASNICFSLVSDDFPSSCLIFLKFSLFSNQLNFLTISFQGVFRNLPFSKVRYHPWYLKRQHVSIIRADEIVKMINTISR